jgi:hypothetical protein
MIMPRADPETALTEAAPVKEAIGLPVGVGGVLTPVDAMVGLATPEELTELEQTVTVTVLKILSAMERKEQAADHIRLSSSDGGHSGKDEGDDVELHLDGGLFGCWIGEDG